MGIAASTVFVAQAVASDLHGALGPKHLENMDGARRLLTPEQILAMQEAYSTAFQKGMRVATGVSAAALVAAAMGWRPHPLTMAEKRRLRRSGIHLMEVHVGVVKRISACP